MTRSLRVLAGLFTGVLLTSGVLVGLRSPSAAASAGAPTVRVSGNQLVTSNGDPIRLLGVNRSGTEYACAGGYGFFDGPSNDASVAAMAAWHINAVRVPLDEACWLGLKGIDPKYAGANYRKAIAAYVNLLHSHHLVVILDLHCPTPHNPRQAEDLPMADAKYSPRFWRSVAAAYKNDHSVLFDVYNEPHKITWDCWLNGCSSPGYPTAGMQSLVDAVRSTGATQPIMLGGLGWSLDLSGWLAHEPNDPARQLVASFHTYGGLAPCDSSCLKTVASVAKHVPVVSGEIGEDDCAHGYIDKYMAWADAHGISYLGWAWDAGVWDCAKGPSLISDYDGTPTNFGIGLRDHLTALAG